MNFWIFCRIEVRPDRQNWTLAQLYANRSPSNVSITHALLYSPTQNNIDISGMYRCGCSMITMLDNYHDQADMKT